MILQYLAYDEEEDRQYGDTYKITGTKEQEEFAEWLWIATKDLSDAVFSDEELESFLTEEGYTKSEIVKLIEIYPDLVSSDPFTAYDQCVSKLKKMGIQLSRLDSCDEPDVVVSI